ncbi:MAG: FHA domain-containing protein [Deltaproteobacteria bacterium]|nr:MAG: FHA domain-containing protein [Deltaproteobacteria bacterium]
MSGAIIGGIVAVVLIVAFAFLKNSKATPPTEAEEATPSTSTEIPTSNGKRNWLIGVSGEVAGKNFWVNDKTVTIGRAASNFIQITDSDASRIHCRIVPLANGVQAHDMDSSNGIFVNEKKVKRHLLQDQDNLQIGDCVFVYHQEGDFEETQLSNNKQVNTDVLRPTMQSSDGDIITQLIVKALEESGGDVAKVAQAVGVPESQIRAIAEENDITPST